MYALSDFQDTLLPLIILRSAYRQFVADGVEQGRRPDLVGGGLVRSLGGWSEVKALRRSGIRELADERILGSGDFVAEGNTVVVSGSWTLFVRSALMSFSRVAHVSQLELC